MSYIIRVGNLAKTPELLTNDEGKNYCYARVLVTDRKPDDQGNWKDTATTAYDLTISGDQACRLVATAENSGNVRVLFAGRYRVEQFTRRDGGIGISHNVRVDEIGVSLKGQTITTDKASAAPTAPEETPAHTPNPWLDEAPF